MTQQSQVHEPVDDPVTSGNEKKLDKGKTKITITGTPANVSIEELEPRGTNPSFIDEGVPMCKYCCSRLSGAMSN